VNSKLFAAHSSSPKRELSNYVPARNTIFLSIALGLVETYQARYIFLGANKADYDHYPDTRPEFIEAFQKLARLATPSTPHLTVQTPLLYYSKAELIKLGDELDVDFSLTVTCYHANERGQACGDCESCLIRKQGFIEAGITDPTQYRK
jgi:7-cyano-7-deazaguanine synthase